MNNLIVQYIRRIGKFFVNKNDKPKVAKPGTNHIDDSTVWTDKTIYEGEQVSNLYTGKLYTSDSKQIVELNRENSIIYGMQVVSIPGASGNADPLYLRVTDGSIRINGKTYLHKAISESNSSPGDIKIQPNTSSSGRYDLIYASGNYPYKINSSDNYYKAKLTVIKGTTNIDDLYKNSFVETQIQNANLEPNEIILLGIVYVPPFYNESGGKNWLRPWSWGVSAEDTDEKYLNLNYAQHKNLPSVTPGFLIDFFIGRVCKYKDSDGDDRKRYSYLKNQIFVQDDENPLSPTKKIYKVAKTHFCESLSQSISDEYIVEISGGGGSSTNIKTTEKNKNLIAEITSSDGDLATDSEIEDTPANNSYVDVKVNGITVIVGDGTTDNCDCYFSNDGVSPKNISDIESGDKLYWMQSYSGYNLDADDRISFFYLRNV